jgi:hypothetical protein
VSTVDTEAPQIEDGDALLGGQEYADFVNQVLGVDYDIKTIYGWLSQRKLPYGRFGGRIFGSRKAVRQALARAAGLTAENQL